MKKSKTSKKILYGSKTSNKLKKIVWKAIPGFTKYEASTDGQIRNCFTEKILKQNLKKGYYMVGLTGDGEQIHYYVHRLVALTYIPNPNDYDVIDHIDNNKHNNNVKNLRWCTDAQNAKYYAEGYKKRN